MEVAEPEQHHNQIEPIDNPGAESSEPAEGHAALLVDSGAEASESIFRDYEVSASESIDDYVELIVDASEGVWGVRPDGTLARIPGYWNVAVIAVAAAITAITAENAADAAEAAAAADAADAVSAREMDVEPIPEWAAQIDLIKGINTIRGTYGESRSFDRPTPIASRPVNSPTSMWTTPMWKAAPSEAPPVLEPQSMWTAAVVGSNEPEMELEPHEKVFHSATPTVNQVMVWDPRLRMMRPAPAKAPPPRLLEHQAQRGSAGSTDAVVAKQMPTALAERIRRLNQLTIAEAVAASSSPSEGSTQLL